MNAAQNNFEVSVGQNNIVFTIIKSDDTPYDFTLDQVRINFFKFPDIKGTVDSFIAGTSGTALGEITFILTPALKDFIQILPYEVINVSNNNDKLVVGRIDVVSQLGIRKIQVDDLDNMILDLKGPGTKRYFTPEQRDRARNLAVEELYQEDYDVFEDTQKITDTLGHYKTRCTLTYKSIIYLPDDHHFTTGLSGIKSGIEKQIKVIDDSRWALRKSSKLLPITDDNPIANTFEKVIEVLPATLDSVKVYYLRKPLESKWGYTISVNDNRTPVFSEDKSIHVDYPRIGMQKLALKALEYLGMASKDQVAMNAENLKNANV